MQNHINRSEAFIRIEINRHDCIRLLDNGLKIGNTSFCEQLSRDWLKEFPGDLFIKFLHIKALYAGKKNSEADEQLKDVLDHDPEFIEAWQLALENSQIDREKSRAAVHVLGGVVSSRSTLPFWSLALKSARSEFTKGRFESGRMLLQKILGDLSVSPLIAIEHLKALQKTADLHTYLKASEIYLKMWPECIPLRLLHADAMGVNGKESDAIRGIQKCVSFDVAGQIYRRIWGDRYRYVTLWPTDLSIKTTTHIPANINVSMNWLQLSDGNGKKVPVSKTTIQNNHGQSEGINPKSVNTQSVEMNNLRQVYVILTSESGLQRSYGSKSSTLIIELLHKLATTLIQSSNWEALVFLPDVPSSSNQFGIFPITSVDPWKVKLALSELETNLRKNGKRIGSVMIIGGDEIVPMHGLPNPTDDSDAEILSDNPYATSDMNYYAVQWQVGRIVGEKGSDPGLLLQQIRQIINFHEQPYQKISLWQRLKQAIAVFAAKLGFFQIGSEVTESFGYSASVWKRSSIAAFRPLGSANGVRISPPYDSANLVMADIRKAKYAFFNLHGLPNTSDWYGQRDLISDDAGVDYPVALTAENISLAKGFAQIVFSEACYGGFLENKSISDSVALTMIDSGTHVLVASTGIAYGSITTPLIGADLLAFIFWKYLREGFTAGEAFLRAKNGFIKVMNERQGFLDGEDQKTLISFVLFGDTLFSINPAITRMINTEKASATEITKFVSDKDGHRMPQDSVPGIKIDTIRDIVKGYLPGIQTHDLRIQEQHVIAKSQSMISDNKGLENRKTFYQMQFTKQLEISGGRINQFVRVTLDEGGKIIKMAVSR